MLDLLPTARSACDATVISDTIYVIGGTGEPGAGTANEAYGDFEVISTTTHIIADNPDPSEIFQTIVVSYQVSSAFGVPTGAVTVTVDQSDVECSGQLMDGIGSCEIVLDTPGTYTLNATYGGDDFHNGSSDNESHVVIKSETTTTIIDDIPDPSQASQPIVVSYQVTSTLDVPTGEIMVTQINR